MAISQRAAGGPDGRVYRAAALAFLIGTVCYTVIGRFWPVRDGYRPLRRIGSEVATFSPLSFPGFALNAVYPSTAPLSPNMEKYGSWRGSNVTVGEMATAWYQPAARFGVFVAGYPKTSGNALAAEVEFQNGTRKVVPIDAADAGEAWHYRTVAIGSIAGAVRMRLLARDGSDRAQGWLGLTEPLEADAGPLKAAEYGLRILLAMVASVTFLLGPGMVLRSIVARHGRSLPLIWIPIPGVLFMSAWGIAIWILRARHLADLLWPASYAMEMAFFLAYARSRRSPVPSAPERKVLSLFLLVVLVASAKGVYSLGPVGELYYGTVSRTTEVGDRSDSRVPFHIVQLVANGLALNSTPAHALFAPYFPTSRGPIAGLIASPIVLLSGAAVPIVEMDQPWLPFDRQGFMAYRVLMVCLAATALLAFYSLAELLTASSRSALLATACLSLSPFFVHETFFTWPKLAAAGFVLLAFYCVLSRRVLQAGLILGFAYLIHPLSLLSLPVFALLIFVEQVKRPRGEFSRRQIARNQGSNSVASGILRALAGCLVCAAFFFAWNRLSVGPDQSSTFLSYLTSTNGKPCHDIGAWLKDRTVSTANTIVPLCLYAFFRDDFRINSIWGPSPAVVRFYFSYWNTLPFAVGIALFAPFFAWMCRMALRFWPAFAGFVVLPFVVFAIYWGSSDSGLMREGLQPWFLMVFLFAAWAFDRTPVEATRMVRLLAKVQVLRVVELLGMLLIPCLVTQQKLFTQRFVFTDAAALVAMIGGSILLGALGRREALSWQPQTTTKGD